MKYLIFIIFVSISCSNNEIKSHPAESVKVLVEGMYCHGCIESVKVVMRDLEYVQNFNISLHDSTLSFDALPGFNINNLASALSEIGYILHPYLEIEKSNDTFK